MGETDRSRAYEEEALTYDQQAREYECFAHDVLFGMCYEYVNPGERLLDLGIGTGLASLPFARAGLEIYGLDSSTAMLSVCQSKGFAKELKCFNLLELPLPYGDAFPSHGPNAGIPLRQALPKDNWESDDFLPKCICRMPQTLATMGKPFQVTS